MKLTKDQVKHIAKLANLPLSNKEEKKYSEQLSRILGYIEQLNQVDTSNVEPTFNVTGQSNIWQEDTTTACLSQEEALSNASKQKTGFFQTQGILDNE